MSSAAPSDTTSDAKTLSYDHLDPAGWRAKVTEDRKQIFYTHTKTKIVVWQKPKNYIEPEWEEGLDPSGNSYYYSRLSRETMFKAPPGNFTPALRKERPRSSSFKDREEATAAAATAILEARQQALAQQASKEDEPASESSSGAGQGQGLEEQKRGRRKNTNLALRKFARSRSASGLNRKHGTAPVGGLAVGSWRQWQEQVDPKTGRRYFYNSKTGDARWDQPDEFLDASEQRRKKSKGYLSHNNTGTNLRSLPTSKANSSSNTPRSQRQRSRRTKQSEHSPNSSEAPSVSNSSVNLKQTPTHSRTATPVKQLSPSNVATPPSVSASSYTHVTASSGVTAWRRGRSRDVSGGTGGKKSGRTRPRRSRTLDRAFDFDLNYAKWEASRGKGKEKGSRRKRGGKKSSAVSGDEEEDDEDDSLSAIPGPPPGAPDMSDGDSMSSGEYEVVPLELFADPSTTGPRPKPKASGRIRHLTPRKVAGSSSRTKSSGKKRSASKKTAKGKSGKAKKGSKAHSNETKTEAGTPAKRQSRSRQRSIPAPPAVDDDTVGTGAGAGAAAQAEVEAWELERPSPRAHSMSPRLRGQQLGGVRSGRKYGPWREAYDPFSSRRYYYHKRTGETTWDYDGPVAEAHKVAVAAAKAKAAAAERSGKQAAAALDTQGPEPG